MKRTLEEILADFDRPIEFQHISKKPSFNKGQKSGDIEFVSWHTLCRLLNQHTGGYWEWKVRTHMGDRTVVEGSLTIHGTDGSLTREATGNESSEVDGYGDPSSNAEAMALRRCCAKFGLGLSMWEKKKSVSGNGNSNSNGNGNGKQAPTITANGNGKGTLSREEWQTRFSKQEQAEFDKEKEGCLSDIGDYC